MIIKFSFDMVNLKSFLFIGPEAHEAILKVLDLQWYATGPKY